MDDERQLMARIAAGDSAAASEVCGRWLDPVYRYIRAHSGCPPEEAEDIVQETFVSFLRSVPSFRGEARIYTWLCAIARRKLIDHYRRQGRRAKRDAGSFDERCATIATDEPLPDELLTDAELRRAVLTELWQLPDLYRQALLDKYVAAKSTEQIAREYGKTPKAVESLLARARAGLRRRLAPFDMPAKAGASTVGGEKHDPGSVRGQPVAIARRRD
jgi:RNA polymerase sigma-70 factor (ECF subfamily)